MKIFPKIFKIHLNLTKHLSTKVRVRFAPKPTSKLHFGKFILCIEGTDR
jgi:hypothetical protein